MQHMVGEATQSMQGGAIVEIGQHRHCASAAPSSHPTRIAQHGVDATAAGKTGENAAGHVPAANNQDFLHAGIVTAG